MSSVNFENTQKSDNEPCFSFNTRRLLGNPMGSQCAGRHFRTNVNVPIYWFRPKNYKRCEDSGTFFKSSKSWGIFENKTFFGVFQTFVLLRGHFCTNFHEILAPGPKLNFMTTLSYKKIILTNCSRVKDPPYFSPKTAKNGNNGETLS